MPELSGQNPAFTFRGGVLYSLLLWTGIVRRDRYCTARLIAFAIAITWLPVVVLSMADGTLRDSESAQRFLSDPGSWARFLIALPILLAAAPMTDKLCSTVIAGFSLSRILPDGEQDRFEKALADLERRKDSGWADATVVVLALALVATLFTTFALGAAVPAGIAWAVKMDTTDIQFSPASAWLLWISTSVFIVVLLRWGWHYLCWAGFLHSVSRIPLLLQPAHADRAGGLGFLNNTALAFIPLPLALGIIQSATLGQEIVNDTMTLTTAIYFVVGFVGVSLAIVSAPLLFFLKQLIAARQAGRVFYSNLGVEISRAFHEKWGARKRENAGEALLATADASALADYNAVCETVYQMRPIPVSIATCLLQASILVLPFLPLPLLEFSVSQIMRRLLDSLV